MVLEHQGEYDLQWAALQSIAQRIGCARETLRSWVRQTERNQGKCAGLSTDDVRGSRNWSGRTES